MTQYEKDKIILLRRTGSSYSKIAEAMNISENTVKSFCRRHKEEAINTLKIDNRAGYCRNCGKPIVQPQGMKTLRFCSAVCRVSWWNSHPECVRHRRVYHLTCACCGRAFSSYGNKDRKYCSRNCYFTKRFGADTHE